MTMESGAKASWRRVAAGRVAAHDRAAIDSDYGITSRNALAINASMT